MSRSDDLASVFAALEPDKNAFGFRQGTIVTFNQATGENTVSVAGTVLTNVPLLSSSESVEISPGDVVVLLRQGSAWCILGRVVIPGGDLAPSAVGSYVAYSNDGPYALTTSFVTHGTLTVPVPSWANNSLVTGILITNGLNSTGANDYLRAICDVNGSGGGESLMSAAPGRATTCVAPVVREISGTSPILIEGRVRTNTAGWASSSSNSATLNATVLFRRI